MTTGPVCVVDEEGESEKKWRTAGVPGECRLACSELHFLLVRKIKKKAESTNEAKWSAPRNGFPSHRLVTWGKRGTQTPKQEVVVTPAVC